MAVEPFIRVQKEDFDAAAESARLSANRRDVGAVVTFTGLCRDENGTLNALELEHYPGMTEKMLAAIDAQAHERWPLEASLIIPRYGRLEPGDRIVLVITASPHRDAAFDSCRFLIDWLKTKAPFWKRELTQDGGQWVDARSSDDSAAERWIKD